MKIRRADEGSQLIPKGCGWSRFLSHRTQAGDILKPCLVKDEEYRGVPSISYVSLMDAYCGDCILNSCCVVGQLEVNPQPCKKAFTEGFLS